MQVSYRTVKEKNKKETKNDFYVSSAFLFVSLQIL